MTRWTRCLATAGCLIESSRQHNKTYGNRVRPLTPAGGAISSGAEKLKNLEEREMYLSSRNALAAASLAALAFSASALAADIKQSGEQKNMKLVGHVALQFPGAYQPNVIQYPDGR